MTSSGLSPSVQFGSEASSTRRKEAGIDTLPLLSTLCWLSPLNLRTTVLSASLHAPENRALETKRRIELLPLPNPPPSSRLAGCPTARATWGDVCSPARRISLFDESGCLYEPAFGFFISGSFGAPVPSSSWLKGCHGTS